MLRVAYVIVALLTISFAGCAKQLELKLPDNEPVKVYDLGSKSERVLLPGSPDHRRLGEWVSTHQSGWSQYLATPPALGIIVNAGELSLQFMHTTVLAHTREGIFQNSVTPDEYAFLRQRNGA